MSTGDATYYSEATTFASQESRTTSSAPYTCKICGSQYKHITSLYNHMHVHTNTTKCLLCNKVLSRKYNLKYHLQTVHNVNMF